MDDRSGRISQGLERGNTCQSPSAEVVAGSAAWLGRGLSCVSVGDSQMIVAGSSHLPPPPGPPPKPAGPNSNSRRSVSGSSNAMRIGSPKRAVAWPVVSTRTSPSGSRPSSPRSHGEESYNSADEQKPCFVSSYDDSMIVAGSSHPPPPPGPPPKPAGPNSNSRRSVSGSSNAVRIGSPKRAVVWPVVSTTRTSPSGSRPSSPRSHGEEGYNSADEQKPCFVSFYDDSEREHQFEIDIRRVKGLEVKQMLGDGNCLFRAVADQVYGDSQLYDLPRQMCIDYMEQERDHFSQFVTEDFTSYCSRKRRDKVYGNHVEIQALAEMYNRPIHIYFYSTEPINIFHENYDTDSPPVRLSYHHGNHYNSLVDPCRAAVGTGLGFSSLRGETERQFEIDIRRVKGLEVKRMLGDGNCLFRAVADQVYGDSELYDLPRQMCIDYVEQERDHFSQFVTEGFTSYCNRKRRDKVYGNHVEIEALAEMYNRSIHIYNYSTDPINIFYGNYDTDSPPVRLSYHHGNHYNSLVDPRRAAVGTGLGFSSLRWKQERDHFSQFVMEGFTAYCKRKRRDEVYGNSVEIQALAEMYNRLIHIYSYSTEPLHMYHGIHDTDSPPVRLSYHHGNHYNSLFDSRQAAVGAGLGFSSLRGANTPPIDQACLTSHPGQISENDLESGLIDTSEVKDKFTLFERFIKEHQGITYLINLFNSEASQFSWKWAAPISSGLAVFQFIVHCIKGVFEFQSSKRDAKKDYPLLLGILFIVIYVVVVGSIGRDWDDIIRVLGFGANMFMTSHLILNWLRDRFSAM